MDKKRKSGTVLNLTASGGMATAAGEHVSVSVKAAVPPPKAPKAGQVARSRPRPRGAGRPKVATRPGARSGDSGDSDDSSGEPEPPRRPPRRLCDHCGDDLPLGRRTYCKDKCSDAARKRRQRERDRAQERLEAVELAGLLKAAVCRCNGRHILDVDDELGRRCLRCGRQRPESTAGQELLRRLRQLAHDERLWSKVDREARDRSERLR